MSKLIAEFLIYILFLPFFAFQTALMMRSFIEVLADLSQWNQVE
jgi:hypothetical protein